MKLEHHHCIAVLGMRGCGKSHLAKNIQKIWPKRVIIDTLGEYDSNNLNVVHDFFEFAQIMQNLKTNNVQNFELIYQFDPESLNSAVEFDQIMKLCFYFGNLQIVLEEVQVHTSTHAMPHWLWNCMLRGRHQNISVLCTTQRPAELHKTILSQCDHVFIGTLIEGNDLRYVASFLGERAEKLSTLPRYRFIYRGPDGIFEIGNDF